MVKFMRLLICYVNIYVLCKEWIFNNLQIFSPSSVQFNTRFKSSVDMVKNRQIGTKIVFVLTQNKNNFYVFNFILILLIEY